MLSNCIDISRCLSACLLSPLVLDLPTCLCKGQSLNDQSGYNCRTLAISHIRLYSIRGACASFFVIKVAHRAGRTSALSGHGSIDYRSDAIYDNFPVLLATLACLDRVLLSVVPVPAARHRCGPDFARAEYLPSNQSGFVSPIVKPHDHFATLRGPTLLHLIF